MAGLKGIANDGFLDRMERAMDVMSKRQQLVASNIGNVDTPGWRSHDLDFNGALRRAVDEGRQGSMRATDPRHIATGADSRDPAQARPVRGLALRNDGNDVNIDREMLALAQTRGRFDVTTSVARMRVRQLLAAIEDGRA
jgi:flagellar basal-body rod protein FlgB